MAKSCMSSFEGGDLIEADAVSSPWGRQANTAGIGLEEIGVRLDPKGFVRTDDTMATSVPDIWAVGDVAGKLQLTHAANRMALVAVRNALSRISAVQKQRFDASLVPWATFTTPEVERVGMTEAEAADHRGRVAYLPMTEVDRAVATGETSGFLKLIAGPRRLLGNTGGGRLLGATAVASIGGELVHEVALAMRTRMFTARLADGTHLPVVVDGGPEGRGAVFMEIEGRRATPASVQPDRRG